VSDAWNSGFRTLKTGEQTVANYVWDTGTLAWVVQTAGGGSGPSSDVNVTNTSIPVTQSGAWTVTANGPLTDAQLRASAVAMSVASLPLPGGAATEATLSTINTKTPSQGQALMASSVPVVIASNQSAVPVSGTFWQATQPVSIATMPSTPVTGTFWQATQPVSGPLTDTQLRASAVPVSLASTTITGSVAVTGPLTDTQLRASAVPVSLTSTTITGNVTVAQATAANLNATVTPIALTKGTQGATGFTTQDLKDAGRTHINLYAVAAAAGATGTETAITLTRSAGTAATTTGTSFVVTNGKTLRITAISVATRGNATATAQTTTFSLRMNTVGAVTTASTPILLQARSATPATANAWDRVIIPIAGGFEIAGNGTIQIGITAVATYTTNAPTWDVTIIGYEY
jgi:hypothetical protein